MVDFGVDTRPSASAMAKKALSLISKGWREVRDSAADDLQLIRTRANTFKNLLNSPKNDAIAELEFVKRIQPKLTEIRRVYSSTEFSRKVFENWIPNARFGISLHGIKNAIVAEVDESGGMLVDFEKDRARKIVRRRRIQRKGDEGVKEWGIFHSLKMKLKQFERKLQFDELAFREF